MGLFTLDADFTCLSVRATCGGDPTIRRKMSGEKQEPPVAREACQDSARAICVGECMLEVSGEGDRRRLGFAGDSLNIAVYMSRILGPGSVAYATRLGDDELSAAMIGFIESEGVDTSLVSRFPGRLPGMYVISTNAGERSFFYWRSEAPVREMLSESDPALERELSGCGCLVVTGITMAVLGAQARERLCDRMSENDGHVSYVVNHRSKLWPIDQAREWHLHAARASTAVFVSQDDLDQLWSGGDGLDKLAGSCPGMIVLTKGERGCLVLKDGKTVAKCKAITSEVVDTTAAGDSFAAGYLAGMIEGQDPQGCAERGARLAAAVIGHHGAIMPLEAMPL